MRKIKIVNRIAITLVFTISSAFAATITTACVNTSPDMVSDGIQVCATIPGLGDKLILPESSFVARVYWEDIPNTVGYSDHDYNDSAVTVTGDYVTGVLSMTWFGGISSVHNIVGSGLMVVSALNPNTVPINVNWVVGQELRLYDIGNGSIWFSGEGSRNWDNGVHAIVQIEVVTSQSPEPSTFILIMMGVLLICWGKVRIKGCNQL